MVKQNLLFQALSLLSQSLVEIKDAQGPLYQKTACLNNEEREVIGILEGVKKLDPDMSPEEIAEIGKLQDFFEVIGISKWPRTELTDLGLRVGQRHKMRIDLSSDILTDTDIAEDEGKESAEPTD